MISAVTTVSTASWYPIQAVLESVLPICDEIVVNVDSTDTTGTYQVVQGVLQRLNVTHSIILSPWNWAAKDGGQELARQTNLAINQAKNPWIFFFQADEALHPDEHERLLNHVKNAREDVSGFEMNRLYFYGHPNVLRLDWTMPLTRLFRKGSHVVAGDAMNTEKLWGRTVYLNDINLWHYSRIGDPKIMVDKIMSLSQLFHEEHTLHPPETYDFKTKVYDSYSTDNPPEEVDPNEVLMPFTGTHPAPIVKWFKEKRLWPEDMT